MRTLNIKSLLATAALLAVPVMALASGGGGEAAHSNPWADIVFKFINFAMLLGIFYYALRKVIPQALRERKEGVARELIAAREAKEVAEAKLAEYQKRVANLEAEVVKLKDDFKVEGEAQKKRLIEEAGVQAANIAKNAAAAGDREASRAIEEIKGEAVRQALALAEEILTKAYAAEDQERALAQTVSKIEGMH